MSRRVSARLGTLVQRAHTNQPSNPNGSHMTHHPHVREQKASRTIVLWTVLTAALAASILTTNVVPIPGLSGSAAAIALGCAVLLVRAHRRRKHAAPGTTPYTKSEH